VETDRLPSERSSPKHALPPAFGKADLTNCEREQIHLAGSIQPHGALLVLGGPGHIIVQASVNAAGFLGLPHDLIGLSVHAIEGDLARCIDPRLDVPMLGAVPLAMRCAIGPARAAFDVVLHRPPHGGLVVELERAGPLADRSRQRAWFRIRRFWVTQTRGNRRPVRVGFRLEGCLVREAAGLPGSGSLGLKRSQAQQGEPMRMALAGHQLPRALALALGTPAAQEPAVVQEEPQQVKVRAAEVTA